MNENILVERRKPLAERVEDLRKQLAGFDAEQLAIRSGGQYKEGSEQVKEIHFEMWGEDVYLNTQDFVACKYHDKTEFELASQALVMYYLLTADGVLPAESWISFSELPDGRFYAQAFQGYTGKELGNFFEDSLEKFVIAARKAGGTTYPLGDEACRFELFPRVSLLVVSWLGDEDFPSTYQVLFNSTTSHYLPTDACAIAGSMLTRRIIAAAL
ncbi:MAG: DUF3786 domain-containing protein [Anaerolineales bacterium]|nr:MAG: DUF3786 domain-containing protein [Anaerolineales bacterium]